MPDSNATGRAPEPEYDAGHVPMTEELDDAKHSLPPIAPVLIALVVVAIIVGAIAYVFRAKPVGNGSIENVFAVEQNTHNTSFVAINVVVWNASDKTLNIKDIKAEITTPGGTFADDAASAVDYDRYLAAYPDLKQVVREPLKVETRIAPGASTKGTVLVNFPVTFADFEKRTNVTVTIIPYDQAAINIVGK